MDLEGGGELTHPTSCLQDTLFLPPSINAEQVRWLADHHLQVGVN